MAGLFIAGGKKLWKIGEVPLEIKDVSSNMTSTPLSLLSYLSVTSLGGANSSFLSHVYDYTIFYFEGILFKGLSCI